MPKATYRLPSKSVKGCCARTTPTILSGRREDQPPTFSGRPYRKRTLLESMKRRSAPFVVSCLSIPGKKSKVIRAMSAP